MREHETKRSNRRGERGSVLAISALSMLALLLSAGLAVDISHFYTAKAELQNAADAAALAGTSQLTSTASGIKLAVVEATKSLNNYDFKNLVTLSSADVTFGTNLNGVYVDSATAQTISQILVAKNRGGSSRLCSPGNWV